MKAFAFFLIACLVLADDCGYFECGCNANTMKVTNYDFYTDQTRKAVRYHKNVLAYASESCEGDILYQVDSIYNLEYVSEENDTSTYNRSINTNTLTLSTQAGIEQLGCQGVEVGSTINLADASEIAKCDSDKISSILDNHDHQEFEVTIVDVKLTNPDDPASTCEITNVDNCAVVYPNRGILYSMYVSCTVVFITTLVVYAIMGKKKPTLPITNADVEVKKDEKTNSDSQEKSPVTVVPTEEKKEEPAAAPAAEPAPAPVTEEVHKMENAATDAAANIEL